MGADVGSVPIVLVREEDDAGLVRRKNVRDNFYAVGPVPRNTFPSLRIDSFQPIWASCQQPKTDIVAGILQFAEAFGLALLLTALRHRDVDQIHPRFPQQPQRQATRDGLVI